ncbi:MAG: hypothetical protein GXO66_02555 [Euryarchaeota archaeon]|nr:hypothetical protein [Euryarchaeota archaeon]
MDRGCVCRTITLETTFCPPMAVVASSLRRAASGEVLLIKASRCQVEMVMRLAGELGAEVLHVERRRSSTSLWVEKR